jgi:general secretion pathway protein L
MSESGLNMARADLVAAIRGTLFWWRSELRALLPESLRAFFASGVSIVAIDVEDQAVALTRFSSGRAARIANLPRSDFDPQTLRAALSSALSRPWYLRDAFALRLPESVALRRDLSLPIGARRNIATLLDMELERQSPLDRGDVFHAYRIVNVDRASQRIEVVWHILKRASVQPALEICRQAGIDLSIISITGDGVPPDGGNLPLSPRAVLLLKFRRRLVAGLLALAVLLAVGVAAGAYLRNQHSVDAFAERVDGERIAAQSSLALEHRIDTALKREALLSEERRQHSVTQLLAETTRLLPQGSWLTEFGYRGGEVHIHGYSGTASSLIALFDASPLFSGAEFRAPLVQAQAPGQEEFDIVFKVRGDAR